VKVRQVSTFFILHEKHILISEDRQNKKHNENKTRGFVIAMITTTTNKSGQIVVYYCGFFFKKKDKKVFQLYSFFFG
jgi:hypothetical protein